MSRLFGASGRRASRSFFFALLVAVLVSCCFVGVAAGATELARFRLLPGSATASRSVSGPVLAGSQVVWNRTGRSGVVVYSGGIDRAVRIVDRLPAKVDLDENGVSDGGLVLASPQTVVALRAVDVNIDPHYGVGNPLFREIRAGPLSGPLTSLGSCDGNQCLGCPPYGFVASGVAVDATTVAYVTGGGSTSCPEAVRVVSPALTGGSRDLAHEGFIDSVRVAGRYVAWVLHRSGPDPASLFRREIVVIDWLTGSELYRIPDLFVPDPFGSDWWDLRGDGSVVSVIATGFGSAYPIRGEVAWFDAPDGTRHDLPYAANNVRFVGDRILMREYAIDGGSTFSYGDLTGTPPETHAFASGVPPILATDGSRFAWRTEACGVARIFLGGLTDFPLSPGARCRYPTIPQTTRLDSRNRIPIDLRCAKPCRGTLNLDTARPVPYSEGYPLTSLDGQYVPKTPLGSKHFTISNTRHRAHLRYRLSTANLRLLRRYRRVRLRASIDTTNSRGRAQTSTVRIIVLSTPRPPSSR